MNSTLTKRRRVPATASKLTVQPVPSQPLRINNCAVISCPSATSLQTHPRHVTPTVRRTSAVFQTPYFWKKRVRIPLKSIRAFCGMSSRATAPSLRCLKSRAHASVAWLSDIKWVERLTSSAHSQNCITSTRSTRRANTSVRH
jgi:hypothetical protein